MHDRLIELANFLYRARAKILFELTDEIPLPNSIEQSLWGAIESLNIVISKMESEYGIREENLVDAVTKFTSVDDPNLEEK